MEQFYPQHFNLKFKTLLSILVGTLIMAIGINGFLRPNGLLSGGVGGIALLVHFLTDINLSILTIVLNIPLFILAFIFLKKRFIYLSLVGMMCLSFWLEVTHSLVIETDQILTVILLGGVLNGVGVGLIFRADASVGGTDIIAKILNKQYAMSMSSVTLSLNLLLMIAAIFYSGIDTATLTATAMFISSRVTNFVVDGINRRRTASIITTPDYAEKIATAIMHEMARGVTLVPAIGGYTHKDKFILYTTVNLREVAKLKRLVSSLDDHAFLTIADTAQVIGNGKGFISFSEAA